MDFDSFTLYFMACWVHTHTFVVVFIILYCKMVYLNVCLLDCKLLRAETKSWFFPSTNLAHSTLLVIVSERSKRVYVCYIWQQSRTNIQKLYSQHPCLHSLSFMNVSCLLISLSWVVVAHACNTGYLGGWDQEDRGWRPAWVNSLRDSMSKNNQRKMDWKCGLSGKPWVQSPVPAKKKKRSWKEFI
jgi:hypothetical protein